MHTDHVDSPLPRFFKLLVITAWLGVCAGLMTGIGGPPPAAQFLSPDYWWLLKLAAGVLVGYFFITYYSDNPASVASLGRSLIAAGLLLLPVFYLQIAVGSSFSIDAMEKRAVGLLATSGNSMGLRSGDAVSATGTPSVFRLSMDPGPFMGKEIATVGMVYHGDSLPENTFYCYRMLMWCCAADARPVGVLVHYDKASELKVGTWVEIEGIVGKTEVKGHELPSITARRVEETAPPGIPYVFN